MNPKPFDKKKPEEKDAEISSISAILSNDSIEAFGFHLSENEWVDRVHSALIDEDDDHREHLPEEQEGQRIGAYELLSPIGTGGMGSVWRARRADKRQDRVVAIKLIRHGMESRNALRRFRLEEQLLARLEHPNIARLYDGGTTAKGRPYLVMEYVDGIPIDQYAKSKDLSIDLKLELFRQVCDAVQYAHGSLVLHRDIKPSNILVTHTGTLKLLDFGIAKLLDDSEDAAGGVTATEGRVLTPRYSSPEQLRGDRLSVATDIYSLGVVLYELLTAQSPYKGDTSNRRALESAILDEQPVPASLAVTRTDEGRSRDSKITARRLKGEIDSICSIALQKEPVGRYRSVYGMGEEIRRHLNGLPLLARPPGVIARSIRLVRRKRAAILAACAGLLVGLSGAAYFVVQSFLVPGWVEEHLRNAHTQYVSNNNNPFYNILFFNHPKTEQVKSFRRTPHAALERLASHYEAALRLDPDHVAAQYELGMVKLSTCMDEGLECIEAVLGPLQQQIPHTSELARSIYASDSNWTGLPLTLEDATDFDLRYLGLLALYTGSYEIMIDAWSRLPLDVEDPFVEALLGNAYLALDLAQRAYPLLLSSYRAFPDSGVMAVYLADAAVRCGDTFQARSLLRHAEELGHGDISHVNDRIKMLLALQRGSESEALAIYWNSGLWTYNPIAVVQLAKYFERNGDLKAAIEVLINKESGPGREYATSLLFVRVVERWWSALDADRRNARWPWDHVLPVEEPKSLASIVQTYAATLDRLEHLFPAPHPLFARSQWASLSVPLTEDALTSARSELLALAARLTEKP